MISFDNLTLKALIDEEKDFFKGCRISKIQQPTRKDFIFTLRNFGKSRLFYINIQPQFYHMCFMSELNNKKRLLKIPQKPPMFCMLLRKYIENSIISHTRLVENERIFELYIESYNEIGEKIYLCLAIELMGKHSNVILYNTDTGIIIGCAHNIGQEKSRTREIYGGIPYTYPPIQNKLNLLTYNGEINFDSLQNDFYMMSKFFAQLCKNKSLEQIKSYLQLEKLTPAISKDFQIYSLYSELLETDCEIYHKVNDMIDNYYSYHIYQEKFRQLQSQLKSTISKDLKKISKSLNLMREKLNKELDFDKYRKFGDLLMANLYQLNDYSQNAKLFDYESNEDIVISLDNTKTIKENANIFYTKYNKQKTSNNKLIELIENQQLHKLNLEQTQYFIDNSQTYEELLEILPEIDSSKQIKQNKNYKNIMCINLENETRIYIGKNNFQNNYIISKLASEEDLWFHVHNNAGSHVLLKTQKITDDLILYCAKLAKEYSSVKNSSKIGVIYTKRKYLRKPPASNLGYVTYRNEKEIIID